MYLRDVVIEWHKCFYAIDRLRYPKGPESLGDSESEDRLGDLGDIDHSWQILQISIACDDLSVLIFCGCVHNRISHR